MDSTAIGVSVPTGYPGGEAFGDGGTTGLEPLSTAPDLSHLPLATVDVDDFFLTASLDNGRTLRLCGSEAFDRVFLADSMATPAASSSTS